MTATSPDPNPGHEIVPFGKYRDRPVTDLLADRSYVDWLMSQPWFPEKQRTIYNVIIGAGGPEPQDTPEHNAMQVRFLDEPLRRQLAATYLPAETTLREAAARWRQDNLTAAQIDNLILDHETYDLTVTAPEFEYGGWDVVYRASATLAGPQARTAITESARECPWCKPTAHTTACTEGAERHKAMPGPKLPYTDTSDGPVEECWRCRPEEHHGNCPAAPHPDDGPSTRWVRPGYDRWELALTGRNRRVILRVELKPSIADDYPSVLRQVAKRIEQDAARGAWSPDHRAVVITDRLQPSSVTAGQVRAIFASRNVDLLLSSEIA